MKKNNRLDFLHFTGKKIGGKNMKTIKKFTVLTLISSLIMAFVSCANPANNSDNNNKSPSPVTINKTIYLVDNDGNYKNGAKFEFTFTTSDPNYQIGEGVVTYSSNTIQKKSTEFKSHLFIAVEENTDMELLNKKSSLNMCYINKNFFSPTNYRKSTIAPRDAIKEIMGNDYKFGVDKYTFTPPSGDGGSSAGDVSVVVGTYTYNTSTAGQSTGSITLNNGSWTYSGNKTNPAARSGTYTVSGNKITVKWTLTGAGEQSETFTVETNNNSSKWTSEESYVSTFLSGMFGVTSLSITFNYSK